jgi:acetylornithine/succinyldiaminopimelate/putrescine aminotransferase
MAAAVARTAIRVLVEEGLTDSAARMGHRSRQGLAELASPSIREIRQIGLWVGIELQPALKDEGMLCKETHVHTGMVHRGRRRERSAVDNVATGAVRMGWSGRRGVARQ